MEFTYELFEQRLQETIRFLESNNCEYELKIGKPATQEELKKIAAYEEEHEFEIPKSFKEVLKDFSADFKFHMYLTDEVSDEMKKEFGISMYPLIEWSIDSLIEYTADIRESFNESHLNLFEECNGNIDNFEDDYDKYYYLSTQNTYPIFDNGAGDLICILVESDGTEKVFYFSHDGGEVGIVYGIGFKDYLDRISQLFFVGDSICAAEKFLAKEPYVNPLVTDSALAEKLKKYIGLTV